MWLNNISNSWHSPINFTSDSLARLWRLRKINWVYSNWQIQTQTVSKGPSRFEMNILVHFSSKFWTWQIIKYCISKKCILNQGTLISNFILPHFVWSTLAHIFGIIFNFLFFNVTFVFFSKSSPIWKHFFKYLFSDELVKTERYLDKIFLLTDPQFSDSSNILYSKNPPCLVYIIYIYKDKM